MVKGVKVQDLLFALARDAGLNVDIHPGISGTVTLSAIDQTLPVLLARIARQADLRIEQDGNHLSIMPDTPVLRNYKLDYTNIAREMNSSMAVTTQVAAVPGGAGTPSAANSGNNSLTRIENRAANRFWETLAQNIRDILRETDKILPEGSSEEIEEVSGNISASGTGQPAGTPQKRARAAQTATELQNRGTKVTRRTTYREAASVIVNTEAGVLSVRATARQHEKIQAFIDQVMEAARKQVLIEATVVEVELDSRYQQGIDWSRMKTGGNGFSISQSAQLAGTIPNVFKLGFESNADSSLGQVRAAITLLEGFGRVKVLSSPKISVLNNQSAVLKVVDNEVYFTMTANTTANQSTTVTTFTTTLNSVPVGFVMNVTPQVSESDQVVLNVRPSISRKVREVADPNPELARANVVSRVPVIRTREMESMIRVDDGSIVVMGGLMEDELTQRTDTLPGLAPESGFAKLLANRDESSRKTELVIFIRPVIVKDARLEGAYRAYQSRLPGLDFFEAKGARAP
jgi:general secretion pathway protein D